MSREPLHGKSPLFGQPVAIASNPPLAFEARSVSHDTLAPAQERCCGVRRQPLRENAAHQRRQA
ncbi:hypothetical protein [Lichenicoccus roseus]|uniref:Uncharacterized protein n=1 Tax=Lichenicoccus roseus TaxID=2683649 RepID=A0A5R9J6C5_9PROT|nr:hypothetical protein [Lichenicoccus roseus]TLU72519.1 hypothetical protein FE263_10695 [Lichenicoccus roseus]